MKHALVAVAHGSRDPRSAATMGALTELVRARCPEIDVRLSFLDLSAPRLADTLAAVHADGHREVVVVPLLLGSAYHAQVDIPATVRRAVRRHPLLDIRVAEVLGPDPRLTELARLRLVEAGVPARGAGVGVVLAGAGSSHPPANAAVRKVARDWVRRTGWLTHAAFAAAAEPDVRTAINRLRAAGARRVALGSWFLAPGLLPDRVIDAARNTADVLVAEPLGAHPLVADVVVDRYRAALTAVPEFTAAPEFAAAPAG